VTAGDIDADLTTARTAYREAQKAYTAYPSPVTRQAMDGALSWIASLEAQRSLPSPTQQPKRTRRVSRPTVSGQGIGSFDLRLIEDLDDEIESLRTRLLAQQYTRSEAWLTALRKRLLRVQWERIQRERKTG
jgi:hypothetical protein